VRAFMVSRTSCEVVLAAAKALSAAWLSEHIGIEAFTSSHKYDTCDENASLPLI